MAMDSMGGPSPDGIFNMPGVGKGGHPFGAGVLPGSGFDPGFWSTFSVFPGFWMDFAISLLILPDSFLML
jgi:hypothetical protein